MMMFQLEMPAILMMLGIFFGAVALPIVFYRWREKKRRQKAEKALDDWVRSNPYQLQSLTKQIKDTTTWGGYPRIRTFKDLSDRISSSGVMGIDLNYLDDAHPLKEQVAQVQAYPEHYKAFQKQLKSIRPKRKELLTLSMTLFSMRMVLLSISYILLKMSLKRLNKKMSSSKKMSN